MPQRRRQARTGATKRLRTLTMWGGYIEWRCRVPSKSPKKMNKSQEKVEAMALSFCPRRGDDVVRAYWFDGTAVPKTCARMKLNWAGKASPNLLDEQENLKFEVTIDYRLEVHERRLTAEECPLEEIDESYRPFFHALIFEELSYKDALKKIGIKASKDEVKGRVSQDDDGNEERKKSGLRRTLLSGRPDSPVHQSVPIRIRIHRINSNCTKISEY